MLRRLAVALIGIWSVSLTPAVALAAPEGCKLRTLLTLPVTIGGSFKPMADVQINGHDAMLLIDSGAFYSILSPATAAEFGLRLGPVPFNLTLNGVGGGTVTPQLTTATLTLGGVTIPRKLEFLVGGSEIGGGARGALGQNILSIADVEYDLANGVIRLLKLEGKCKNLRPTYWTKPDDAYSVMDISWATPREPFTEGVGVLNGSKIKMLFDTGSWASMLSLRAASRAGIKTDSPGVTPGGTTHGIGRVEVRTWIAPFESFKIGDEEIRNTHLRMGDLELPMADMLIGADFFLSHRVYVSSGEHKMYFTYNGGPVFNLTTRSEPRQVADRKADTTAAPAQSQQTPPDTSTPPAAGAQPATAGAKQPAEGESNGEDPTGVGSGDSAGPAGPPAAGQAAAAQDATISGVQPTTADGFFRRGAAYLFRNDYEHALADLGRACELNPQEPKYFFERATAYLRSNQPGLSDADIDTTLKLKPDYVNALLWRAQRELAKHDKTAAVADLDAADRAAPPQEGLRLEMARTYMRAGAPSQAVKQFGLWIDAHREDINIPGAYVGRCWARALSGQELEKGLSDCNKMMYRLPDKSGALASRGLVYLRLGKYQRAISDYNDALKQHPRNAWALYGRGMAEFQLNNTTAADADFSAATAVAPHIAEEFKKHGIAP